jgi:hypothetical protein
MQETRRKYIICVLKEVMIALKVGVQGLKNRRWAFIYISFLQNKFSQRFLEVPFLIIMESSRRGRLCVA